MWREIISTITQSPAGVTGWIIAVALAIRESWRWHLRRREVRAQERAAAPATPPPVDHKRAHTESWSQLAERQANEIEQLKTRLESALGKLDNARERLDSEAEKHRQKNAELIELDANLNRMVQVFDELVTQLREIQALPQDQAGAAIQAITVPARPDVPVTSAQSSNTPTCQEDGCRAASATADST